MKEIQNNTDYSAQSDNLSDNDKYVYGNNTNILYVIKQKMKTSTELSYLVNSFAMETDDTLRIKLTEKILICLTGAGNIPVNSKGNFINAQYLYVLETLDKLLLISFSKKSFGHVYSELELADLINREFENLKIELYTKLILGLYFEKQSGFIKKLEFKDKMNYI